MLGLVRVSITAVLPSLFCTGWAVSLDSFNAVMPSLPQMRGADLAGGTKEELVLMYKLGFGLRQTPPRCSPDHLLVSALKGIAPPAYRFRGYAHLGCSCSSSN